MNWNDWVEKCAAVLKGNQIASQGFRYTRPAPHVYEFQWLWDSCFHAITYRWFDPKMAQDELISLTEHQVKAGADAGMVPHMTYWNGSGVELWGRADRSIITQPPLISIAAWLVYEKSQDRAFLEQLYPRLVAYQEWFDRRRDPDGDHLVCLIHPWETGLDASPRWDLPMKLDHPTPEESKAARHRHVKVLMEHDCDAQSLGKAGHFHVETLDYNAIRAADLESLAEIAGLLGDSAERWRSKAHAVQTAVQAKLIRPEGFVDLNGLDEQPIQKASNAPFVLLFGGCLKQRAVEPLVQDLTSPRFWTNYPVPTTPTDDELFSPNHYWRGNVWLVFNWLIYQGLRRYGYVQEASHIAQRSLALVEEHSFHEYFNPLTGDGCGPDQQSWSTIALDMLATEEGR